MHARLSGRRGLHRHRWPHPVGPAGGQRDPAHDHDLSWERSVGHLQGRPEPAAVAAQAAAAAAAVAAAAAPAARAVAAAELTRAAAAAAHPARAAAAANVAPARGSAAACAAARDARAAGAEPVASAAVAAPTRAAAAPSLRLDVRRVCGERRRAGRARLVSGGALVAPGRRGAALGKVPGQHGHPPEPAA